MTKWAADKVERKSVNKLIPYERNPKIHSDSQINQLANSITEWGWTIPILVDEKDMVIAGHGRLYAA
ncbi:MAG TPA: DNA methylase, partial [Flavobacteriaceae bacterium]|nr:DNA methylase [Flavobacteriaceae bacterium]